MGRRKWRQIDPLENYKKCPGRVGCGLNLTRGYRDGREYNTEMLMLMSCDAMTTAQEASSSEVGWKDSALNQINGQTHGQFFEGCVHLSDR